MEIVSSDHSELALEQLADLYIASIQTDIEARQAGARSAPRVGDLWTTRGRRYQDLPAVVVVTCAEPGSLRAVVAFEEPELASSDDVLVAAEQSPTGAPLALCSWRDVPIAAQDLDRLLGVLPDSVVEPLTMLLQRQILGGFEIRPVDVARLSTGETALRWTIESTREDSIACEFLTGAQILRDADPRLRVRQILLQSTLYLERDALEDIGAEPLVQETQSPPTLASRPSASTVRFPALAQSGRLAELGSWRDRASALPRVFPVKAA